MKDAVNMTTDDDSFVFCAFHNKVFTISKRAEHKVPGSGAEAFCLDNFNETFMAFHYEEELTL